MIGRPRAHVLMEGLAPGVDAVDESGGHPVRRCLRRCSVWRATGRGGYWPRDVAESLAELNAGSKAALQGISAVDEYRPMPLLRAFGGET
jgi:hypothetical protein